MNWSVINNFLSKAYNAVGLKILNDAADKVPAVRYAGAVLIFAMLGAAGLALFHGSLPFLLATVVSFVVVGILLIVLGAASSEKNKGQAQLFSWVIVIAVSIAIGMVVVVVTSCFLFEWPRPIGEILQIGEPTPSLDNASIELERDANGNLLVMTQGVPRQPYSLDIDFVDPKSKAKIGNVKLRVPDADDAKDPSGLVTFKQDVDPVICELNLKSGKKVVKSRSISVAISKSK